jgi:acyl carrier protein
MSTSTEAHRTQDELLRFIVEELAARHGWEAVAPEDDLIRRGIVDSLGVQELVAFCEARFGIAVESADLLPENFASVERLAAFVDHKRAAPGRRGRRFRRRRH